MNPLVFQLRPFVRKRKTSADLVFKVKVTNFIQSSETSSKVKMRNLILKSWYMACTIFCLYSLNTVIEERYQVAILAGDPNRTDLFITLACQDISKFKIRKNEIHSEKLKDELAKQINRKKYLTVYHLKVKERILNRLQTGHYVIFKGLFCVFLNEEEERGVMRKTLSEPVFFAFKRSTLDFAQMASWSSSFGQLTVQMRGPPYSNCSESNGKFACLNECFKARFRLARYFFWSNETKPIHLSLSTNRTIETSERSCFEKCWRENCEIVQFIPAFEKPRTIRLESQFKLSGFDFWIQFIGLVCSFANISLNQFTSLLIKSAVFKVKRRRVRVGLLCVKWAILFLSLTYCGYLYTSMVLKHQAEERNPNRKEIMRNLIKQNTLRLAICVNIEGYFPHAYLTNGYSHSLDINHLNKTMSEIEKATDNALDDYLQGIHLNYQGRLFRVNYIPEPKVLFRKDIHMYRCFTLSIRPDYQLMPTNPKLTVKFRGEHEHKLYLLTENENLNGGTFEYTSRSAFMKRVIRRLKSNGRCVKYRERYGNCTSRLHCVERCINKEAHEVFKKIAIGVAVMDKDQFSLEEWTAPYPLDISNGGRKNKIYLNLSSRCVEKFQDQPCTEFVFDETVDIVPIDVKTKEIDLLLDVELSIEEFTWFNLLLNLLNIQSIFFGMTVLKFLTMLYSLFKPKLGIRNEKIVSFLMYLLCSIGFTWHTYHILDRSINEQLSYVPNYEVAKQVRMPVVVFCVPIEEKLIDKNQQLTGHYLEQVTSHMSSEGVFQSIIYMNESIQWTPLNLSLVERFFFMHSKCFNITINREYDRRQLYFSTDNQVLKVNFGKWFWNQKSKDKTVFFMTKTNETAVSNVLDLVYHLPKNRYSAEQSQLTVSNEDQLRFMKRFFSASYEDDFGDLDRQLPELNGSEFRFRTFKVPVEEDDFDFELKDDLFDQLFTQIKNETTYNFLDDSDYQQAFVYNQLKKVDFSESLHHFTFSLALIKRTVCAKNDENVAKLVLNLLNTLFIWFDLGILDLHPIFILSHDYLLIYLYLHWPLYLLNQITRFVLFSHRWLKKFESPLYKRLDADKRNSTPAPRV